MITPIYYHIGRQGRTEKVGLSQERVSSPEKISKIMTSMYAREDRCLPPKMKAPRSQSNLSDSENLVSKFKALSEDSGVGLAATDPRTYRFLWASPRFSEITGYSEEEIVLLKWTEITRPVEAIESDKEGVQKILDDEVQSYSMEKQYVHKNGSLVEILLNVIGVYDDKRNCDYLLITIEDQTRRKGILKKQIDSLQQALDSKGKFIGMMSHELRQPFHAIMGALEMIRTDNMDSEQREWIGVVKEEAQNFSALLNRILDFSKIDYGAFSLHCHPFDLQDLLSALLKSFQPISQARHLTLNHQCNIPEKSHWLFGDGIRLKEVISNLIGNALKFTETGGVSVHVTMKRLSQPQWQCKCEVCEKRDPPVQQNRLECDVIDSGSGIPPEKLEAAFAPFTQLDSSPQRRYCGSGLGLPTARELVRLMGGDISHSPRLEGGSIFRFYAFFSEEQCEDRTFSPLLRSTPIPSKRPFKSALIVDDLNVNRKVAGRFIQRLGASYDEASDGFEAISQCKKKGYDLILVDYYMPCMDGLTMLKKMKADNLFEAHLPPIFVGLSHPFPQI